MTTVVHLRNGYDVYIGRAGKDEDGYFGNPFLMSHESQRATVLTHFRGYFFYRIVNDDEYRRRVLELKGKRLGCFCKPKACHGDVIKEWLDAQDAVNCGTIAP